MDRGRGKVKGRGVLGDMIQTGTLIPGSKIPHHGCLYLPKKIHGVTHVAAVVLPDCGHATTSRHPVSGYDRNRAI